MKIKTRTMALAGSNYEIGTTLGKLTAAVQPLKELHTAGFIGFDENAVAKAQALFGRWCPGLVEELQGFADALQVKPAQVFFCGMTSLRPNCSQLALLPSVTQSGRPLLARSYEFSHEAEDFTLVKTSVSGKYMHLGTSVLLFGRDDGINECGLAITMSSCGFPVGAPDTMRRPKLHGLQYWAVLRSLLENCATVDEALDFLKEMPIAFNINLMLVDKDGNIALYETVDGHRAFKRISDGSGERYLCAANHPVLPELIQFEPQAMRHSLRRDEWIRRKLDSTDSVSGDYLKDMLLSKYPDGLCCHFFNDYFGTTKSMVIDPGCGTIELCWGGKPENGWRKYNINDTLAPEDHEIDISFDRFDPYHAEFVPLDVPIKQ